MDLSSRLRADRARAGAPQASRGCAGSATAPRADLRAGHRPLRGDRSISTASPTCSAGVSSQTRFGRALVVDRRYESDRFHGTRRDRRLRRRRLRRSRLTRSLDPARRRAGGCRRTTRGRRRRAASLFVDLETTGLSGGAGTRGVSGRVRLVRHAARSRSRQFLLTSYAAERALLARRRRVLRRRRPARHLQRQDVRRAGDGDAVAVPPHARCRSSDVPHFDMLHPARRLVASRAPERAAMPDGRRLPAGDARARAVRRRRASATCPGFEIPARYFRFPAQRRRAAARAGARAQPARSGVAGRGHGARAAARARRPRLVPRRAPRRWRSGECLRAGRRRSIARCDVLPTRRRSQSTLSPT